MSSRLHRGGLVNGEVVVWEPASKDGAAPVRYTRDAGQLRNMSGADLDQRRWEAERAELSEAAYQRGLQEGTAAGRQQGAAQIQPALERLARTIEEIGGLKPRLRHEAEQDVVKLALAIARRILYRELATDPDALLGLVRSAVDKLDGREALRVRLHPQDAAIVQQKIESIGASRRIEISSDASLQRGSAIFDTAQGSLDASVDTQLREIERGFADLVRRGS